jgi:hypothetical protein
MVLLTPFIFVWVIQCMHMLSGTGYKSPQSNTIQLIHDFDTMLYSIIGCFLRWTFLCSLLAVAHAGHMERKGSKCILTPGGAGVDDSPAILDAFRKCGHNGHIIFQNTTYHIERVMNTTGLVNCVVDIKGTLLVGDLIS